jgi:hypothetical protein
MSYAKKISINFTMELASHRIIIFCQMPKTSLRNIARLRKKTRCSKYGVGHFANLIILQWSSDDVEVFRSYIRVVPPGTALLADSFFRVSWEIRLTRNKRGERSERVRSWRKDKIGVAGGFAFSLGLSKFVDPVSARRAKQGGDSAKQDEARPCSEAIENTWFERRARRCAVVGDLEGILVRRPRRVSRSCNQMPDWIISIIWNVYGADKGSVVHFLPVITTEDGRALRARDRRSRYFTCVMIIRSARNDRSQINADSLTRERRRLR